MVAPTVINGVKASLLLGDSFHQVPAKLAHCILLTYLNKDNPQLICNDTCVIRELTLSSVNSPPHSYLTSE